VTDLPRPSRSTGDFDYEQGGLGYSDHRRADPRIEAQLHRARGDARTVINVGAGAGSYEPRDRHVVAVEPSPSMRALRARDLAPAVDAVAENLPYDDDAFDAAMATITVHQWPDAAKGLAEMRRVTRGPVVVLTFDPEGLGRFWLADYSPEVVAVEQRRFPSIAELTEMLGGPEHVTVENVPVPLDCTDGFGEAYYARPEQYLRDEVRRAQSGWAFVDPADEDRFVRDIGAALADGSWDTRHGHLRAQPTYDGSIRLVISRPQD
jgi:SAM-dependent methyltransferase